MHAPMIHFVASPAVRARWGLFAVVVTLALGLSGCDRAGEVCAQVDRTWHQRDLVAGNLLHWLAAAPTPTGFFRTGFSREWRPGPDQGVALTAQTRIVYALIRGYDATGERGYLDAAIRGGDFLLTRFRDPALAGWFEAVGPNGEVRDGTKKTYGHAFVILTLAHLYRVTQDSRYRDEALVTWGWLNLYLRDPQGGFAPEMKADLSPVGSLRTQNPVMHLFEAMLALWETTRDPEALAGVRDIGGFVLGRLLQPRANDAFIPEWYSAEWKPLAGDGGGYIDLGHQFEWAYLLSAAANLGLPPNYAQAGEQILAYAMREGYDADEGGCYNRRRPEAVGLDRSKGWWQQSETLRTLMHYAALRGRSDLWEPYRQTLDLVRRDFADAVHGGWYPSPLKDCPDTPCTLPQAGYGYHIAAMHSEALALTAQCEGR